MTTKIKQILRLSILFLLGVMGLLWLFGRGVEKEPPVVEVSKTNNTSLYEKELAEQFAKDTDSDGLKDWEEVLWKTNISVADTDGDGTADGVEVEAGRDPLKKGPNDIIPAPSSEKLAAENLRKAQEEVKNLSVTDRLARDTFTLYLKMKNSASQSNTDINSAIDQLTAGVESTNPPIVYGLSSLIISNDESPTNLKKYANDVGEVILKNNIVLSYSELDIFNTALSSNDMKKLEQLSVPQIYYKKIADGLKVLAVPQSVSLTHLALVNSFNALSNAVSNMRNFPTDPILGMAGAGRFKESYSTMVSATKDLKSAFIRRGLYFDNSDPASIYIR